MSTPKWQENVANGLVLGNYIPVIAHFRDVLPQVRSYLHSRVHEPCRDTERCIWTAAHPLEMGETCNGAREALALLDQEDAK